MAQDTSIAYLLEQTFKDNDARTPVVGGLSNEEFTLRRKLSCLPVKALEGEWLVSGLARFSVAGSLLDLPTGHTPLKGWSSVEGQVCQYDPFLEVNSQLLGEAFTHVFVVQSIEHKPWLVFWNEEVEAIDVTELRNLFAPFVPKMSSAA